MSDLYQSDLFSYVVLPLLIIVARISDVTFGTVRIVMVSKGQRLLAPVLGFFEVIIWLVTMTKVLENVNNWVTYVAYGLGFALGNYIGLIIEEKLAMGIVQLQVVTRSNADALISKLKGKGYGITYHEAHGAYGNVAVIYSIIKRNNITKVVNIISEYNPQAFYSIADVKFVSKNITASSFLTSPIKWWRKGK